MDLIAVCTTVADEAAADRIAAAAVEQGLAACVQQEPITSTYRWQGRVQREAEIRLLFKTTREAYARLEHLILSLHPYELPAVYAVPVAQASAAYGAWVTDNVVDPGAPSP